MKSPRGGARSGEGLGGGWSEHCQVPHGATMVMFSVIWWFAGGGGSRAGHGRLCVGFTMPAGF
jgi:hypothetical protein